jgi:hypothetical protein
MAQASRFGSITPTTIKGFIPILADPSHIAEEVRESGAAKSSLSARKRDIKSSAAQIEAAAENVVDPSQIGQVSAGFKAIDTTIDGMIDRLGKYESLVGQYEQFLSTNTGLQLCCVVDYSNSSSNVRRFGIDTDCLTGTAGQALASISVPTISGGSVKSGSKASSGKAKELAHLLHPLEVHQIREAIKHMNAGNKTALVDIFERLDDGSINIDSKTGKPGVHTILLTQLVVKGNTQILVIDPSNSEFSRHLVFNKEIICGVDAKIEIVASSVPIKIYSVPSKAPVGPAPDQYRDCSDIAVKLAFGLNKHSSPIDMSKLAQLPFVQEVTNSQDIHKFLFLEASHTVRARQSSIDWQREKIYKILLSTKTQAALALQYKSEMEELQLYNEIAAALYPPSSPSDYNSYLIHLIKCHDQHADLIGQIMKDFVA